MQPNEINEDSMWAEDVKLYTQLEAEQILLPDNANCLSVQAFMKMCNINFEIIERKNAEAMSPSGRVPFVKCGAFLISEFEPLTRFVRDKGTSLTEELDKVQMWDMRAYMSLINTVLYNIESYITWVDNETFNEVTKLRFGSVHPWPLNWYLTRVMKKKVMKRLQALGWLDKSLEQIYEELDICCSALSERLEDNEYFFGDKPTELDALVFGHVFTILTTPLPSNQFAATIRCYPKLVSHCQRVEERYFSGNNAGVTQK